MFFHSMCRVPLLLLVTAAPAAELTLHTDFPGGSAEVLNIDSQARRIEIAPANHFGRGWPCWWYFRIDGAAPGETITVKVSPSAHPFREKSVLAAGWSLPARPALSSDNVHWSQIDPNPDAKARGVYLVTAPATRFWLAWGPPFLPSHADKILDAAVERLPDAKRFVLARTLKDRPVSGVRIGDAARPGAIWVQARQHAWESGGSWVGSGFLDWVTSDDPQALALRNTTEIHFVPIMDVDNVTLGAGGKEAVPRDHNRDWSDEPVYPEVAAAQKQILELNASGRLRLYIDLHNPGPSDLSPYFYGPFYLDQFEPDVRRRYGEFLDLAIDEIAEPLAIARKFRRTTYIKSDDELGRMSSEWVRRHTGPNVVALTLETAWNTPHSNTEGYQSVGRGLARTIARFLADKPSATTAP